jgi:tripartite-type tricarboxylate transporter receptor subunit TctC
MTGVAMQRFISFVASVVLLAVTSTAHGQTEPFFKGKTIKIVVGFTAGGIIDLWARLFTQYLGKYIAGNPDLVVQNTPGVPTIYELMDKHKTPDPIKRFATVLLSPGALGRPLITPPNMPPDRLKLLRDAYAKMISDPEFLADAKKRDWEVEYITGQDLEAMAKKAVAQTPDTVERLKAILGK